MTDQEIVNMLREKARAWNRAADILEGKGAIKTYPQAPKTGNITQEDLEKRIRSKSGRINDIANEFGVQPSAIQELLQASNKVYLAERGWLKIRE